jgi:hypothetical protein
MISADDRDQFRGLKPFASMIQTDRFICLDIFTTGVLALQPRDSGNRANFLS